MFLWLCDDGKIRRKQIITKARWTSRQFSCFLAVVRNLFTSGRRIITLICDDRQELMVRATIAWGLWWRCRKRRRHHTKTQRGKAWKRTAIDCISSGSTTMATGVRSSSVWDVQSWLLLLYTGYIVRLEFNTLMIFAMLPFVFENEIHAQADVYF